MYQAINILQSATVNDIKRDIKEVEDRRDTIIRSEGLTTRGIKDHTIVRILNKEILKLRYHMMALKGKTIVGIRFE